MELDEKLVEIKSEADALISFANKTTGNDDERLGEAVRTLASGFGGGGGSWKHFQLLSSVTTTMSGQQEHLDFGVTKAELMSHKELLIGWFGSTNTSITNQYIYFPLPNARTRNIIRSGGGGAWNHFRVIDSNVLMCDWYSFGNNPSLKDAFMPAYVSNVANSGSGGYPMYPSFTHYNIENVPSDSTLQLDCASTSTTVSYTFYIYAFD